MYPLLYSSVYPALSFSFSLTFSISYIYHSLFISLSLSLSHCLALWYKMVAENMLRTYEVKKLFSEKKIGFDDSFDEPNAFYKSKYLIYFIRAPRDLSYRLNYVPWFRTHKHTIPHLTKNSCNQISGFLSQYLFYAIKYMIYDIYIYI